MNPNRRILAVVLSVFILSSAGAETVIDQLYGVRKYELADAYWAAGQKFADLGQADRAAEFKAKAKSIFPGYVPGQAPVAAPATPVPAPQLPALDVVKENNLQGEKIARLQFQKLLRGYLTGSAPTVTSVLASSVEVQGQSASPDAAAVAAFLEAHPAQAGAPDDLFQIDTLDVADSAGQTVVVTVKANPNAPADLADTFSFWKATQAYTFDRVADTWKLIKIEGR